MSSFKTDIEKRIGRKLQAYKNETYQQNGPGIVPADANGVQFLNPLYQIGVFPLILNTTVAYVNQVQLPPGVAYSVGGNRDEWDETQYSITFSDTTYNVVIVVRKRYQ